MMKMVHSKLAVSEVIGVVLLLGITICLFAVLNLFVSSFTGSHSAPLVSLTGTIDKENQVINIQHDGGESLEGSTNIIIRIGTTTIKSNISEIVNHTDPSTWQLLSMAPDKNPDKWDFGETVQFHFTGIDITDKDVQAMVVDPNENTLLLSIVLQRGSNQ